MEMNIFDNVYDERIRKGLYTIISEDKCENNDKRCGYSAIIIYLYYEDSAEKYRNYINQIPDWIDIYIISSNPQILDNIKRKNLRNNIFFKEKPNIGRDVSALLVTSKDFIWRYEYICFIHDKKEKNNFKKKDTDEWISNLWGNTIENNIYIENVLKYMNDNVQVGMMCPMEPISAYSNDNFWGANYNNTIELAKEIKIDVSKIVSDKSPIALGTVFWARIDALRKLLDYDWQYSDFVEEPMPDDGTISHAIERVLPYVVQDAGYEVHTIMTKGYASKIIAQLYDNWLKSGIYLRNKLGIRKADELSSIDKKIKEIIQFCSKYKKLYIYGAGRFAVDFQNLCKTLDINLNGCIVTNINSGNNYIEDIPTYEFGSIDVKESGIILAVNKGAQKEIINNLNKIGVYDIYIYRN